MTLKLSKTPLAETCLTEIHPEEMEIIRHLLYERTGFPLFHYKEKCVMRRINIRIRATNAATPGDYCKLLKRDERELKHLLKTLTIHVSSFFRNPSVFDLLRNSILPELFSAGHEKGDEIMLRSIGCSSGEEPYTLAIILKEYFGAEMKSVPVRITGTDINPDIIEAAKEGLYLAERLSDVPQHITEKYFTPENGKFRINPEIREMVTFHEEDIFSAGIMCRSDMILCRNVMIYFERPRQENMLIEFADSLAQGGFLVLGKSETVMGEARSRFHLVSPEERIFRSVKCNHKVMVSSRFN
jgi:chemotaxis protein methyltransferase CheR